MVRTYLTQSFATQRSQKHLTSLAVTTRRVQHTHFLRASSSASSAPHPFLEWSRQFRDRTIPLQEARQIASWLHATTGNEEQLRIRELNDLELKGILSDPQAFALLSDFRTNTAQLNPLQARELEILWREIGSYQFDPTAFAQLSELEMQAKRRWQKAPGQVEGSDIDFPGIRKILQTERDSKKCQAAWEASRSIGLDLASVVIRMVKIRNAEAQKRGFHNFYEMELHYREIDPAYLKSMIDQLAKQSDPAFSLVKASLDRQRAERFGISVGKLRPWHFAQYMFAEYPSPHTALIDGHLMGKNLQYLALDTMDGVGLDLRPVYVRSDFEPREKKNKLAFCSVISRRKPRDIRLLCNLTALEYWISTLLHESGHGAYRWYVDETEKLPYFLQVPAHELINEGVAIFFERFTRDHTWLTRVLGVSEENAALLVTEQSRRSLIKLRFQLLACHFERELYRDPDQDLNALWWQLVQRYQALEVDSERHQMPDWCAIPHFATSPVYYQSYLLGELFAAQLKHYTLTHVPAPDGKQGLVGNPNLGKFLKSTLFTLGASLPWDQTITAITGEKLNSHYRLEEISSIS